MSDAETRHPMTGNRMDPGRDTGHEHHEYDVVVIGAGGAGLRAAIAAHEAGLRVAVICKSLFGKAHTVMAEGGCAAAMGNANSNDNWQVHYRDTMRGGKFLNNWRMAELHAQEAPDRVWELETYGALVFGLLNVYDGVQAFHGKDGGFGIGLGTVIIWVNLVCLWLYTLSCHACRHIVGGRLKNFSKHPLRYRYWTFVSKLNPKHGTFAMTSLFTVILTDFYIMAVSAGWFSDLRIIN